MLLHARMRRRDWVLTAAIAASIGASAPARADGTFVGDDGVRREFEASYREGYRPGRREPHYVRASVEMLGLLGIGSFLYYTTDKRFKGADYSGVSDRFQNLEVSFDTSTFNTNAIGHPGAGSMYVLFARTNGHSIPVSFAYAALSSAVWEMAIEIPENPSLNDFVVTPVSGVSIGEFLVHAGDYFNSTPRKPRWTHEVFGLLFGFAHRVHRALDDYQRPSSTMPADSLGFSSYYSHRFDLLAGPVRVVNDAGDGATGIQVRVNTEIVSIPGFLRPGRFAVNFTEGNFVEALAQVHVGRDANAGELFCDANLFGRFAQNISEGDRKGIASMFAFNSAARYADRFLLDRRDSYYLTHVAGPAFKLWAVNGDFVARLDGTAHFDVGAIRSLAFPEHTSRFGDDDVATVMKMHGYYFGLGWSAAARGTLAYKSLELGGRVLYGRYDSIDSGDRFPAEVPRAIHTSDRIGELEGWAGVVSRELPLQVRAFFAHFPRSSTMSSITETRWDRRFGLTVGGYL